MKNLRTWYALNVFSIRQRWKWLLNSYQLKVLKSYQNSYRLYGNIQYLLKLYKMKFVRIKGQPYRCHKKEDTGICTSLLFHLFSTGTRMGALYNFWCWLKTSYYFHPFPYIQDPVSKWQNNMSDLASSFLFQETNIVDLYNSTKIDCLPKDQSCIHIHRNF